MKVGDKIKLSKNLLNDIKFDAHTLYEILLKSDLAISEIHGDKINIIYNFCNELRDIDIKDISLI